jgi:hypothetical protein
MTCETMLPEVQSEYVQVGALSMNNERCRSRFVLPNFSPKQFDTGTFGAGSTGRFEVLQSGSSGGFGFWTGVHHAKVVMPGKEKPVPMQLRTSEVFRAEDGAWKLVHRHADMAEAKK